MITQWCVYTLQMLSYLCWDRICTDKKSSMVNSTYNGMEADIRTAQKWLHMGTKLKEHFPKVWCLFSLQAITSDKGKTATWSSRMLMDKLPNSCTLLYIVIDHYVFTTATSHGIINKLQPADLPVLKIAYNCNIRLDYQIKSCQDLNWGSLQLLNSIWVYLHYLHIWIK